MTQDEEYRKIFDFFFSGVEVPKNLKLEFHEWMREHGDTPEVRDLLQQYWKSVSDNAPDFDMSAGLESLMASIERNERKKHRRIFGRKTLKWIAGIAASAAVFTAGWTLANLIGNAGKETVLMASSENVSSYTLPDGTKVWLNKDSWLSYRECFGRRTRKVSICGEGFFEVTRDEEHPFVVKMYNDMEVKVLGTSFNVCSYPDTENAEVILRTGSVKVSDSENRVLAVLKPDQKYTWSDGLGAITPVNATDCCRWYEHRLSFDNVMLQDIIDNLAHKYQMQFTLNIGKLSRKRMSLTVRDESVNEVLDVLSSLLPVTWRLNGNEIVIENKPKTHK